MKDFRLCGNREADVYSFAIIMQEIATSDEPYFAFDLDLEGLHFTILSPLISMHVCTAFGHLTILERHRSRRKMNPRIHAHGNRLRQQTAKDLQSLKV